MKCLHVEPEKLQNLLEKIEFFVLKLDENLKFKIMLICEEVITNQLRHTDFEGKIPDIEVCFDFKNEKEATLIFKDNAKKFNPLDKKDPDTTKDLEDVQTGGLGIFMVKNYSKNQDYEYNNGYNILKVRI